MSPVIVIGILLLIVGVGVVVYLITQSGGADVQRKLAELNLQQPSSGKQKNDGNAIHKMLDDEQRRSLQRRLQEAGGHTMTASGFVIKCLTYAGIGGGLGVLLMIATSSWTGQMLFVTVLLIGMGAMAPNAQLNRAIERRKIAVQRELPDFLDVVTTTVEAGIALNGALNVAVDALHGPLGEEMRAALADIRLGRSRAEALAAMAQRLHEPDLTTTVTAIIQAEKLGGNIVFVLNELAIDARDKRLMRAEEAAAQLPVKLVFPMAGFMLPALFMIIFGALAAKYVHL